MMCRFSLKNISRSLPRNPSAYMQPQNGKAGFKPCRDILPDAKHEFSGSGQGRLLADRHAGKSFRPEAGLSIATDDLEWQAGFLFAGLPANRNRFCGRNLENRGFTRSEWDFSTAKIRKIRFFPVVNSNFLRQKSEKPVNFL